MASIQGWILRLLLPCPVSTLLVCLDLSCCWPQWLKFHAHPSRPAGQFNTEVQVNYMAVPHIMHTYTCVHITLVLLSISFFTLLPPPSAGRLAQSLQNLWCRTGGYNFRLKLKFFRGTENICTLSPKMGQSSGIYNLLTNLSDDLHSSHADQLFW